ncbi:cell division topological specificity factor MinE [Desulfitibacter alkalitolerans]|uniref:cell division topological specificity factor MinE n=1 Tax=Desulfitibacter alkalitolerans TaxID=264641 RepID=UPI00048081A2|nr:cell division topological specificity factor MinE [Desulfitibacter alkalitolerans]
MLQLLQRILGVGSPSSKTIAKERLRLVLLHDRTSIPPHVIEALKGDLIQCISKYMEIDENNLDVSLSDSDESVALVANIPILKVRQM